MIDARKKLLLMPKGAQPFTRSGSFEPSNNDGWVLKRMVRAGVNDANNGPRTGTWYMGARRGDISADAIEYTLQKSEVQGLRLTFSIWEASVEGGTYRLSTSYDGGTTFSQIATGSIGRQGRTHSQLSWTFDVGRTGVVIRLAAAATFGSFDDWSISGARR